MITCLNKLFKDGDISEEVFNKLNNANKEDALKYLDGFEQAANKKFKNSAKALKKDTDLFKETVNGGDITPTKALKNLDDLIVSPNKKNVETTTKFYQSEFLRPIMKNMDKWKKTWLGFKAPTKLYDSIGLKIMKPGTKVSDDVAAMTKDLEDGMKLTNDAAKQHGIKTIELKDLANLSPKIISGYSPKEFRDLMKPLVNDSIEHIDAQYQKALAGDEVGKFSFTDEGAQEYVKKFGGNPIANYNSYANRIAGEIAGVQIFGKNPIQKIEMLGKMNGSTEKQIANSVGLYRQATHSVKQVQPSGNFEKVAVSTLLVGKSLATVELMGQAIFMTIVDPVTMRQASKLSGTPFFRQMFQGIKMMASQNKLRDAQQMLGQAETVLITMNNTMNRVDSHAGPLEFLNKAGSAMLKGTGLVRLSEANVMASKMGTLMSLADNVTNSFSQIAKSNPKFHNALIKYGITEADWKKIRTTPRRGDNLFLDASKIDETVRHKVFRMMDEQANMSVIQAGAKTRNFLAVGDKGTLKNTAAETMTQFKSSMVEFQLQNWRMLMSQTSGKNKALYTGEMMVGLAMMGMTINMLKDVASGKTPEDPTKNPYKSMTMGWIRAGGGMFIATQLENLVDPKFWTNKDIVESSFDMLSPASLGPLREGVGGLKDILVGVGTQSEKDVKKGMARIAKEGGKVITNAPVLNVVKQGFNHQVGMWEDPSKEKKKQRRIEKEMKKNNQTNLWDL